MFNRNLNFVRKNVFNSKINRSNFRINKYKYNIQPHKNFYAFPGGSPNGNEPEYLFVIILGITTYYILKKI
jgi:hypothetical protein